jgi:chloride channel protein, CIC family
MSASMLDRRTHDVPREHDPRAHRRRHHTAPHDLGDFTAGWRLLPMSVAAIAIGALGAVVALALLELIGLFTNLFFFGRWDTRLMSPAGNQLGLLAVAVPVAGALIVGLMARYGSERIRGHGIPEALESILINGSRIEPRVALLKPLSAAISIGSGGPFGAEGPIIMTGGAFGSMIAQFLELPSAERKTLLVAGAAAGIGDVRVAARRGAAGGRVAPLRWKPRSMIPVALASATAAAARRYLIGLGPLFPVPPHPIFIGPAGLAGCAAAGLLAGALSAALTGAVYAAEDAFKRLPIHWMWWPALGGIVIGLGGLVFPEALGVGYDTIGALVQGEAPRRIILGLLVVKSIIWSVSTSAGRETSTVRWSGRCGGIPRWRIRTSPCAWWSIAWRRAASHGSPSSSAARVACSAWSGSSTSSWGAAARSRRSDVARGSCLGDGDRASGRSSACAPAARHERRFVLVPLAG